jgi:hypothetical protein
MRRLTVDREAAACAPYHGSVELVDLLRVAVGDVALLPGIAVEVVEAVATAAVGRDESDAVLRA